MVRRAVVTATGGRLTSVTCQRRRRVHQTRDMRITDSNVSTGLAASRPSHVTYDQKTLPVT